MLLFHCVVLACHSASAQPQSKGTHELKCAKSLVNLLKEVVSGIDYSDVRLAPTSPTWMEDLILKYYNDCHITHMDGRPSDSKIL